MKSFIVIVALCVSAFAQANTGKLVGGLTYLDDYNQTVSPSLGVQSEDHLLGLDWTAYLGGGVIQQPEGSTTQNTYARAALDVGYALSKELTLSVGGGLESAKATYHQFDDYVHLKASYQLW